MSTPLPPQHLLDPAGLSDPGAPGARAALGARVLQIAFALFFLGGLLGGGLSTWRMEAIRGGASISDMMASQQTLLIALQILHFAAEGAVLYGLSCLLRTPPGLGAAGPARAAIALRVIDLVMDLATRFVPPLRDLVFRPVPMQVLGIVGSLLIAVSLFFLVEALRRIEAAGGGDRVTALRGAYFAALLVSYVVSWALVLLPVGAYLGGTGSLGWGGFAFREIAAALTCGLLLVMLEATRLAAARIEGPGAATAAVTASTAPPGTRDMIVGGLFFCGGALVTVFSYSAAREGGGRYVVAYGAVVFGLLQFLRGLMRALSR